MPQSRFLSGRLLFVGRKRVKEPRYSAKENVEKKKSYVYYSSTRRFQTGKNVETNLK